MLWLWCGAASVGIGIVAFLMMEVLNTSTFRIVKKGMMVFRHSFVLLVRERTGTMEIIERKPIPLYESTCPECKSVFRYKAVEVSWMHVYCPVCGQSMWASLSPVAYVEKDGDGENELR